MRERSKIDQIRDEIDRIGAWTPDVFKPRLDVSWHFSDMVVTGKRRTAIPFQLLLTVLKSIPADAGEDAFWKAVDSTDFDALHEKLMQAQLAEWKKEDRLAKRRLNQSKVKRKNGSARNKHPKKRTPPK